MKTLSKNLFFLLTLVVGLTLIPVGRVMAQTFTFGPQIQSTPSATMTYDSGSATFQYSDTGNSTEDYAGLPLAGAAAAFITTTNGWTATINGNISARSMTATSSQAPYVETGFYVLVNNSVDNYVKIVMQQLNYTDPGDSGSYGTVAVFEAVANGKALSKKLQVLTKGTSASPVTESIKTASGALTFTFIPLTETLTGYYNGTVIGSYSLAHWGSNLPLTLYVVGSSGDGIDVPAGTVTVSNFYAALSPSASKTFSVTTTSSPAAGGTTTGAGKYTSGQTVTVTAEPDSCFAFSKWTEKGKTVSTDTNYAFTVTGNVALVAEFAEITYKVTTTASPANGGSTSGGGTKECGSTATVTAQAKSGFKFVNWTEGSEVISNKASIKIPISGNVDLTANFADIARPTLTLTSPTGNETTTNSALTVSGKAKDNVQVTGVYYNVSGSGWLTAQNKEGWTNWSFSTDLALGTNVIKIFAQDSSFLNSTTNTLTVIRKYVPDIAMFPIDTAGDVTELQIQCAFDGNNYLVVYQTSANVGQFVSPSGELVGGQLALNGNGDPPVVAFDGTNYLTAWESYLGGPSGVASTISGTFVGRDGTVGNPGQLIQSTTVDNYSSIAFGGGVYFLTWTDSGGDLSNHYLEGAMISPSGEEVVNDFIISKAGYQTEIGQGATAFDGTNFLATWGGTQGGSSVNGRLISPAGNFVTDPFVIYTNKASATKQVITAMFDGTKYLVLFCPLSSTEAPANLHIQGRFITTTGKVMAKEINLTKDSGPQIAPGGAFDGTNYLLTWSQGFDPLLTSSSKDSVKAGIFDVNGNPISTEFTLFSPQGGEGALWAPVLFDGTRFFSAGVIGKIASPSPDLTLTNVIISGAFVDPY